MPGIGNALESLGHYKGVVWRRRHYGMRCGGAVGSFVWRAPEVSPSSGGMVRHECRIKPWGSRDRVLAR
jgi:hypothetical protein